MVTIYIIECEHGKYYVGKSTQPNSRILQHFDGNGSEWTRIYKPVRILEQYNNSDSFDEDKFTLKMMEKYGINNVRGGSFVKLELDEMEQQIICKMLKGASDRCFLCGKQDHFISKCPDKNKNNSVISSFFEDLIGKSNVNKITNAIVNLINQDLVCQRCGRDSHTIDRCYAKLDVSGNEINSDSSEEDSDSSEEDTFKDLRETVICYRCGRGGHNTNKCYAKTDVNGKYLSGSKRSAKKSYKNSNN